MQDKVLEQVTPLRGMTVEELTVARNALVPLGRTASPEEEALKEATPLKRVADPSELGGVVVFLAGDHASYVSGATLNVSGGFLMYRARGSNRRRFRRCSSK